MALQKNKIPTAEVRLSYISEWMWPRLIVISKSFGVELAAEGDISSAPQQLGALLPEVAGVRGMECTADEILQDQDITELAGVP